MLNKFFKVHKLSPFSGHDHPRIATPAPLERPQEASLALKIVHAGGKVERYYMAIPAARILEKYPSFVLAKPEVFRKPWGSVVRPEKILYPGQKFYLVPPCTVKKLQRRIRKPSKESSISFVSQTSNDDSVDMVSHRNNNVPSNSISPQSDIGVSSELSGSFHSAFKKVTSAKKHVTFAGIDVKHRASSSSTSEKKGKKDDSSRKSRGGMRRARNAVAWQPSLKAISEHQGD